MIGKDLRVFDLGGTKGRSDKLVVEIDGPHETGFDAEGDTECRHEALFMYAVHDPKIRGLFGILEDNHLALVPDLSKNGARETHLKPFKVLLLFVPGDLHLELFPFEDQDRSPLGIAVFDHRIEDDGDQFSKIQFRIDFFDKMNRHRFTKKCVSR